MRKLIFILLLFIPIFAFAEGVLTLESDKNSYFENEIIKLNLSIKSEGINNQDQLMIKGLDSFVVVGQQVFNSVVEINGEVEQNRRVSIDLKSKNSGIFELGPVVLGDEESNTISIEVLALNTSAMNSVPSISEVEEDEDTKKEEDIDEMKDIFPIKDVIWQPGAYYIYVPLLLVVFFTLFYAVLSRYLNSRKNEKVVNPVQEFSPEENIALLLAALRKDISKLTKSEFYSSLNQVFRVYFENIGIENATKLSFDELEKSIKNKSLSNLFKESYYCEFKMDEEDESQRKQLISKFLEYLGK